MKGPGFNPGLFRTSPTCHFPFFVKPAVFLKNETRQGINFMGKSLIKVPLLMLGWVGPFLLLIWFLFSLEAAEVPMEEISLKTTNGDEFVGFIAGPEDAKAGILLVHDWFGVSPFYKETVLRLAGQGYRVLAIDFYGGEAATTHKEAFTLMQKAEPGAVAEKVKAGLEALKEEGRNIATFGFSLGTEYAYRAALADTEVDAVVIWYGFTPAAPEDVEGLDAEVLIVLGSLDGPAADQGATYSKLMDGAGKKGGLYIFPGGHHAFAQPLFNAGATYDPEGAAAAWAITDNFLERTLKKN